MFTKQITSLTLAGATADGVFPNIQGVSFNNDVSFLATLRALMHKRIPSEESIFLRVTSSSYSANDIGNASPRDCIRAFLRGAEIVDGDCGNIHIHSFNGDDDGNTACFNKIDNGAVDAFLTGFKLMPDMVKFLEQRKIRSRFYINEEKCSVLIFIERMDMKRWHLLQSFIPRYFPKYFSATPLDEKELKLIKALTNRYAPEYEELIEEATKQFDFRTAAVRNALRGFENKFEKEELQSVRYAIQDYNAKIANLNQKFADYYQQIRDLTTKELGLIAKIRDGENEEDSEFLEYFLCNKSLELVRVNGARIEFIVKTTISSFDPDVFDSAIHKDGSFFYRHYETGNKYENEELTDERIKKLMLAIFQDETLKLRVCAAYRLDFANGNYAGLENYPYPDGILLDHTPNQHIQHYGCLGNNRQVIADAMLRRDYVGAVSACCSSATNINFTEPNTGTFFMQKICAKKVGKIIQMPDGSTKTPVEAVKWLEEQEATRNMEEVKHE